MVLHTRTSCSIVALMINAHSKLRHVQGVKTVILFQGKINTESPFTGVPIFQPKDVGIPKRNFIEKSITDIKQPSSYLFMIVARPETCDHL